MSAQVDLRLSLEPEEDGVRVEVKLRGWLRDFLPADPTTLDVPEGTTVLGLMDLFHIPVGPCLWIVNGEAVGYDTSLNDGDHLEAALMASGG